MNFLTVFYTYVLDLVYQKLAKKSGKKLKKIKCTGSSATKKWRIKMYCIQCKITQYPLLKPLVPDLLEKRKKTSKKIR